MIAEHPPDAWSNALDGRPAQSRSEQELATLLLAVNYELLGYPPEHAAILARRDETGMGGTGRFDG